MSMATLNVWAVLGAAVAAMALAALWFSPPVFGKVWMRVNGFNADAPPKASTGGLLVVFVLTLVMSANLAMFLNDPKTTLTWGATAGFLAGFGWVAMAFAIASVFEKRSIAYVLVNGGYFVVALVVMGAILGGWR